MTLLDKIERHPDSILTYKTQPESFEFHQHEKGQLTFFEGGSSHLFTEDGAYFVPTHHFVWVPSALIHKFVHLKKQNIWVSTLYIPKPHCQGTFFNTVGIYVAHPLLIEILKFTEANEYFENQDEYSLILTMLQLLPRLTTDQLHLYLPITSHYIIKEVVADILIHLGEPLTVASMAQKYHLGERTFIRLFLKEIDMTFFQYLKTARIMRSIELIIQKELSLTEIAFEVGYSSLAAYSNAFFSLMDKRPTEFKT